MAAEHDPNSIPLPRTQHLDADPTTGLPPAGYARDEELRQRTDNLNETAEQYAADANVEGVANEKVFEPDREFMRHIVDGNYPVSNARPDREYCWVWRDPGNRLGGRQVMLKKVQGWQIVDGDMLEAKEHRYVDGTRVIGDIVLMWMRKDYWLQLQHAELAKKRAQEASTAEGLHEMAARAGGAFKVYEGSDINPQVMASMASRAEAQTRASSMQDQWIKEGKMPGVPAPQRR